MDGNFSDLLRLLKNGQESDSFTDHSKHNCDDSTSRTYLRKYMTSKVVNHLNMIGTMKTFTKPNCNLFMEERLTIPKKLCDKRVMVTNRNWRYTGPVSTNYLQVTDRKSVTCR